MENKCSNCGYNYKDDDLFCAKCGTKLSKDEKTDVVKNIQLFDTAKVAHKFDKVELLSDILLNSYSLVFPSFTSKCVFLPNFQIVFYFPYMLLYKQVHEVLIHSKNHLHPHHIYLKMKI